MLTHPYHETQNSGKGRLKLCCTHSAEKETVCVPEGSHGLNSGTSVSLIFVPPLAQRCYALLVMTSKISRDWFKMGIQVVIVLYGSERQIGDFNFGDSRRNCHNHNFFKALFVTPK